MDAASKRLDLLSLAVCWHPRVVALQLTSGDTMCPSASTAGMPDCWLCADLQLLSAWPLVKLWQWTCRKCGDLGFLGSVVVMGRPHLAILYCSDGSEPPVSSSLGADAPVTYRAASQHWLPTVQGPCCLCIPSHCLSPSLVTSCLQSGCQRVCSCCPNGMANDCLTPPQGALQLASRVQAHACRQGAALSGQVMTACNGLMHGFLMMGNHSLNAMIIDPSAIVPVQVRLQ